MQMASAFGGTAVKLAHDHSTPGDAPICRVPPPASSHAARASSNLSSTVDVVEGGIVEDVGEVEAQTWLLVVPTWSVVPT